MPPPRRRGKMMSRVSDLISALWLRADGKHEKIYIIYLNS
jgi:hypothetical protein